MPSRNLTWTLEKPLWKYPPVMEIPHVIHGFHIKTHLSQDFHDPTWVEEPRECPWHQGTSLLQTSSSAPVNELWVAHCGPKKRNTKFFGRFPWLPSGVIQHGLEIKKKRNWIEVSSWEIDLWWIRDFPASRVWHPSFASWASLTYTCLDKVHLRQIKNLVSLKIYRKELNALGHSQFHMFCYCLLFWRCITQVKNDACGWTIPVVPARGGAEVGLGIYIKPFSSIELACAVRQSPCVRAFCESGVCFLMSHLKLHFALHISHCALHTPHFTLHTPHFTLRTALFELHTSLHTALLRLHTSHSTFHTSQSHFSLLSSHSTLHTAHSTLHTAPFTPHTSHCTLHTPTSSHLSSSHLIPAHLF